MARFDKPTEEFMTKLAGEGQDEQAKPDLKGLRTLKSVVKSIQDPHKALGKALINGVAMKALFEKEGGIKVLGIYGILNEHYGREWWHWEPETVWQTLNREHGIAVDDDLRNLISALQLTVTTNQPFENWHIFEKVGHAFNFNPVNFGIVQPLEMQEAALALRLLRAIRPKQEFDSEICGYLAAAARNAGVVYLPESVFTAGCQSFLDEMGNDTKLRDLVAAGKDDGSEAYAIQVARLREISDYVKERI